MPKVMNDGKHGHWRLLRIDAPEWYVRQDFLMALDDKRACGVATWREKKGQPAGKYDDVFVTYDHGELSDDLPEDIVEEIAMLADLHQMKQGVIHISNVGV